MRTIVQKINYGGDDVMSTIKSQIRKSIRVCADHLVYHYILSIEFLHRDRRYRLDTVIDDDGKTEQFAKQVMSQHGYSLVPAFAIYRVTEFGLNKSGGVEQKTMLHHIADAEDEVEFAKQINGLKNTAMVEKLGTVIPVEVQRVMRIGET
jgi:hypothetical protein